MGAYILRRLLLIIPTLLGIMLINFTLAQFVPGGPVEQAIARAQGGGDVFGGFAGSNSDAGADPIDNASDSTYVGARGLPPEFIAELEKEFGFDKPPVERFINMMWNYMRFDFGESYFRSISVIDLIKEKLPVSITLGLWSTLIAYMISIPLGIRKAVRDGSRFDTWTSGAIIAAYAIPGFLFAILLLVLFAGGSYWQIFPLRGLTSDNFDQLSLLGKIGDYFWHITLPVLASTISAFATLTLLTKNSFLDEIKKHYVMTARAKGLSESKVLYGHVFRNAMLIVIAGFPAVFIGVFFGSSLIIETIFSLDGLGRLAFEATVARDYPIVFGSLFIFGLIGLLVGILSDLMYVLVDPRIDFERREG
ncbi:microcin C ABC transporter permease YejB [Sulfitobacter mediterraneus]|jgi:microcin C transport system permease protein|uniref:Microcin ABC transporter permease n=1 Tax=Sulfitobacter mediterraneus TaxID=83219 RepID=A0A061SWQ3_9RHOB|nr:microcin C ABC transporter permease YejB [Sulfitobacter mediterraneus]KAJ04503.1 microcin ABC transporter permease [Sulfitobacter mediterraneus]KIN78451.1 Peptide ABC transporter, permease protein [Sulfitobacter mediterraneus KCTC 32188]MBM1310081.1 microcin C ABC transporter permease YejB [Sulfitobacter mediterraneus]MBM1313965.1 microcin C ABC transporter permease YejB [Sulfitobacter mediterraneus]MBM1322325.1 microcin C ABC transporter permease YejB [Sulfitobacter mediterraneus]